jgi:hypothetical protein
VGRSRHALLRVQLHGRLDGQRDRIRELRRVSSRGRGGRLAVPDCRRQLLREQLEGVRRGGHSARRWKPQQRRADDCAGREQQRSAGIGGNGGNHHGNSTANTKTQRKGEEEGRQRERSNTRASQKADSSFVSFRVLFSFLS